jgi:hypothetical protein
MTVSIVYLGFLYQVPWVRLFLPPAAVLVAVLKDQLACLGVVDRMSEYLHLEGRPQMGLIWVRRRNRKPPSRNRLSRSLKHTRPLINIIHNTSWDLRSWQC